MLKLLYFCVLLIKSLFFVCTAVQATNQKLFFRTRRGKIVWSTAYSIFVPCGFKIGDATFLKMYYVTSQKALKLRKSSKETARCRNHPSPSFRKPRNEDSQNIKPQSTSESPETILLAALKLTNFTRPVFKLRNTQCPFTEALEFLRWSFSGSTWLSCLHSP